MFASLPQEMHTLHDTESKFSGLVKACDWSSCGKVGWLRGHGSVELQHPARLEVKREDSVNVDCKNSQQLLADTVEVYRTSPGGFWSQKASFWYCLSQGLTCCEDTLMCDVSC